MADDLMSDEDVGLLSDDEVGLGSAEQPTTPAPASPADATPTPSPQLLSDSDVGLLSDEDVGIAGAQPTSSQPSTSKPQVQPEGLPAFAARKVAHDVLPLAGGIPGAELGAAAGSFLGPVGAIAGGLAGAIGGGYLVSKAQDFAMRAAGIDDSEIMAANEAAHPLASTAIGVGEAAALFRFDKAAPAVARGAGALLMGGIEAGSELANGEVDPKRIAANAAAGAIFTDPRKVTRKLASIAEPLASKIERGVAQWRGETPPGAPINSSQQPQVSPGTAVQQSPPTERADVGNPQSAPVRSDRDYGVSPPQGGNGIMTIGNMDEATYAALQQSLGVNELTPPKPVEPIKRPEDGSAPIENTGLAEAAVQHAPAKVNDPAAGVVPPTPNNQQNSENPSPGVAEPAPEAAPREKQFFKPIDTGLVPPATENAQPTSGFTTSDGSKYVVQDKTTARIDPEQDTHAVQPPSARTVYVTKDAVDALHPRGDDWALVDHGDGTISNAHLKGKKWTLSDEQSAIPYSEEPAVGLHPLELAAPAKINGLDAYGARRVGHDIVSTEGAPAAKAQATPVPPGEQRAPEPAPVRARTPVQSEEGLIEASRMQREAAERVRQNVAAKQEGQAFEPEQPEQQPARPAKAEAAIQKSLAAAAKEVDRTPTEGQKEAGNYKKGHVKIDGFDISLESTRGMMRRGVDPKTGEKWEVRMPDHYGYIKRTEGADGDHVDTYIGKGGKKTFIVDQLNADTGKFDEHKVMMRYPSREAAVDAYNRAFSDGKGPQRMGAIHEVTPEQLKDWINNGDTKKPFGDVAAPGEREITLERARPGDLVQPRVVTEAVKELQSRGLTKVIDHLNTLSGVPKVMEANRILRGLQSKTGDVPEAGRARSETARPTLKVGDVEVTGRSKGDVERKAGALKKLNDAFEKHAPAENETREQTLARVTAAVNESGSALKDYRPNVKPKEWLWMREAQRFLQGSKTEAQRQKFVANELQLRSGNPEDVANVRDTGRIESDIGLSRRSGEEAITTAENNRVFDTPHEESEEWVPPKEIKSASDLEKPTGKELDLSSPKDLATAKSDSAKVSENLIKDFDKERAPSEEDTRAANMDKQRRAREAAELAKRGTAKPAAGESEGAASTVRRIPIDDSSIKAAMDALKKAEAKSKSREAPEALPPEREPQKISEESALKAFWNDERGSLDLNKIKQQWRATSANIKASFEKYLGVPMTELGRKADAVLARAMSQKDNFNAQKAHALDARWYMWQKAATPEEATKYLSVLESANTMNRGALHQKLTDAGIPAEKADWMVDEARFHKQMMDDIFQTDKAHGNEYDYIESYVPHLFEDEKAAREFIEAWGVKHLGARWYQKERSFDSIAAAVAAGFKLRYKNPIDIINARWGASINANLTIEAATGLHNIGAAFPMKDAPEWVKKNWDYKVNLPDGQQWVIAPEAKNLWKNAMEAKGLYENETAVGSVFRNWMKIKNLWTPIKLMMNAFHEVHVAGNINPAVNIARAIQLSRGGQGSYAKNLFDAAKWSLNEPLFSLPVDKLGYGIGKMADNATGNKFSQFPGRQIMHWWELPADQLTPDQKVWVQIFKEGGVSPTRAAQDVIGAKRAFQQALQDKSWKAIPHGIRRGIELAQAWMFNYQIPALKNIAYMRNVSAAFALDPTLASNPVKRGVVLRALGQNLDDRYGEMFYNSLFWNKTLKDAGIGSMLSLSWNLGQARQVAGSLRAGQQFLGRAGGANGKGAPMQEAQYRAGDKGTFLATYVGLSMLTGGALSYALSGQMPTGLDYFFPRNGEMNSNGTPQRLSPPFNTREPFMLIGHEEQHNSWVGGAMEFLWNKMVLEPIVEAWQNRDFYGNKLYDTNAPWYKRALQLVDSTLGEQFMPIAAANASRADAQGAGMKGKILSYSGFSPAPRYLEASALENRIGYLFGEEGTAYSKPYQYGEKTGLGSGLVQGAIRKLAGDELQRDTRKDLRQKLDVAIRDKDTAGAADLRRRLVTEGGMGKRTAERLGPDSRYEYMFAKLPLDTQKALVKNMSAQEFTRFVMLNHNDMSKPRKAELMKERGINR